MPSKSDEKCKLCTGGWQVNELKDKMYCTEIKMNYN